VSRATFKCRVISTELSADLGRAFASAKHGACCALSVERIAFSVLMSELTIGVVHFDNSMPLRQHDKKLDFKIPIQVEALRAKRPRLVDVPRLKITNFGPESGPPATASLNKL
jgi:hypothetical protein